MLIPWRVSHLGKKERSSSQKCRLLAGGEIDVIYSFQEGTYIHELVDFLWDQSKCRF